MLWCMARQGGPPPDAARAAVASALRGGSDVGHALARCPTRVRGRYAPDGTRWMGVSHAVARGGRDRPVGHGGKVRFAFTTGGGAWD